MSTEETLNAGITELLTSISAHPGAGGASPDHRPARSSCTCAASTLQGLGCGRRLGPSEGRGRPPTCGGSAEAEVGTRSLELKKLPGEEKRLQGNLPGNQGSPTLDNRAEHH